MGLTLHYSLHADTRSVTTARDLIEKLRQRALSLPFKSVGPLLEFSGEFCDFSRRRQDDPSRWLLIQACGRVHRDPYLYDVPATHVIAFDSLPGDGSEPANFGLARYPATITDSQGKRIRTGLSGWRWRSFCKTQYASNPKCGGVENFLRSHLSVVKLLDHARELGILGEVKDEGRFWERRDIKALALEVGEWNEMIAAGIGKLKDCLGGDVEAPITSYPDYEHLEAKGQSVEPGEPK